MAVVRRGYCAASAMIRLRCRGSVDDQPPRKKQEPVAESLSSGIELAKVCWSIPAGDRHLEQLSGYQFQKEWKS